MTSQIIFIGVMFLQTLVYAAFATLSLTPRWHAAICFALYSLGEWIAILISPLMEPNFILKAVLGAAFILLRLFVLYKDSIAKKLIVFCELVTVMLFVDLFLVIIISLLAHVRADEFGNSFDIRIYGGLVMTFLMITCYACVYSVTHHKRVLLQNSTLRRFLLFPLGQAFLIFCVEFSALQGLTPMILVTTAIAALFCIVSDVMILYTMRSLEENARLEKQVQMMQYTAQMQLSNYENIKRRDAEIAKLQHDYKNHLAAISVLIKGKDTDSEKAAAQLLESLQQQYSKNWTITYCEHYIVNAVLTCKHEECVQHTIELQESIVLPEQLPVEDVQLCSIFANLLDNAIHAVTPLPPEKRKISVKTGVHGTTLFVNVANPYDATLMQKGTGYGLHILREIAAQYRGTVITNGENGIFTAIVSLEL
ncbi:MAG: GHKL domain-containing protein [Ruthenibacterium sp.]